jgi:protein-S-isoprenylcysteine O-methyltransferase Ste14
MRVSWWLGESGLSNDHVTGGGDIFMSAPVLIEAAVFIVLAHLFVTLYEEPALRRQFGESYKSYSQTVGRWIPRSPP